MTSSTDSFSSQSWEEEVRNKRSLSWDKRVPVVCVEITLVNHTVASNTTDSNGNNNSKNYDLFLTNRKDRRRTHRWIRLSIDGGGIVDGRHGLDLLGKRQLMPAV